MLPLFLMVKCPLVMLLRGSRQHSQRARIRNCVSYLLTNIGVRAFRGTDRLWGSVDRSNRPAVAVAAGTCRVVFGLGEGVCILPQVGRTRGPGECSCVYPGVCFLLQDLSLTLQALGFLGTLRDLGPWYTCGCLSSSAGQLGGWEWATCS